MKPMTLNLSKMKKIGGDENHSVFMHPSGHKIAIAHAGVSALQRKQLEKLPVEKFDDGGEADPETSTAESVGQDIGSAIKSGASSFGHFAGQVGDAIVSPVVRGTKGLIEGITGDSSSAKSTDQTIPPQSPASSSQSLAEPKTQTVNHTPAPASITQTNDAVAPIAASDPLSSQSSQMNASLQSEKSALRSAANTEQNVSAHEADLWSNYSDQISKLPSPQEIFQKHQAQDQQLMNEYMNNKVDPSRFWNTRTDSQKIYAGIGMVLGGIGSALTRQPNYAMEVINNAINRDIESQKNDQSKSFNLWQMNRQATNDELQATLATQNQMLSGVKAKALGFAAQAGGAEAQMKIAPLINQIDQQMAQNNLFRSINSPSASPGSESGYVNKLRVMEQVKPEMYKDMQSKYIPGVGVSRIPLTPEDRSTLTGYDQLGHAINDAISFQKTHGFTVPGTKADAEAESKRNAIILELNTLHGLKRLNDNEFDTYKESVSSPGAFMQGRAAAKLGELKNQIDRHQKTEMMHLGIVPFHQAPQDQQAIAWAKANPQDPRAARILQANGQGG